MKNSLIFTLVLLASSNAASQPAILLEACNNIADSSKRLSCLQELNLVKPAPTAAPDSSQERVRNAFLGLQGSVDAGLSYLTYSQQIIEPASALSIYTNSVNASPAAVLLFESALQRYKDAQLLWQASINNTQDGGIFGRIFNPQTSGLSNLVRKYDLVTVKVLFDDHLPIEKALAKIWSSAKADSMAALASMDRGDKAIGNPVDAEKHLSRNRQQSKRESELNEISLRGEIVKRTGLQLSNDSMVIVEISASHGENQKIPIGSVVDSVASQKVVKPSEFFAVLEKMKTGENDVELVVLHEEVPKTFRLVVR